MATPSKRAVLTYLQTQLATITTGNGYKTTVNTVTDVVMDWETSRQDGPFPWIGVKPARNAAQHFGFNEIRSELTLQIVCHVEGATDSAAYDALENLLDDIIVALGVDTTCGGECVGISYVADETDEGDPDKMDSHGGSGSMVIEYMAVLNRTTSAS